MATVVGTATLAFGSTPTDEATVTVTGLSGISQAMHKEAYVQSDNSTATNTVDDHRLLGFSGRFTCEYVSSSSIKINCDLLVWLASGDFTIHYVLAD